MNNFRLIVNGEMGDYKTIVNDAVYYTVDSPFADRRYINGHYIDSKESVRIIEEFNQFRSKPDKAPLMSAYHFVLIDQSGNMNEMLNDLARSIMGYFQLEDYQALMVPHEGGTNLNIGAHWHFIVNPVNVVTRTEIYNVSEFYRKIVSYINSIYMINLTCKYKCRSCFVPHSDSHFVEVFNPNDIL